MAEQFQSSSIPSQASSIEKLDSHLTLLTSEFRIRSRFSATTPGMLQKAGHPGYRANSCTGSLLGTKKGAPRRSERPKSLSSEKGITDLRCVDSGLSPEISLLPLVVDPASSAKGLHRTDPRMAAAL
jgi:hypothetical protein